MMKNNQASNSNQMKNNNDLKESNQKGNNNQMMKNTINNKINNQMNNNNQMLNNNQMMQMNNINNNIYNPMIQSNNINNSTYSNDQLNNNEKQEQLLEINYMRKKLSLYEEKIKILEEKIKQKDSEIACLKMRFNNNFIYNQNIQPFNYNPMMMTQMNNFMNEINHIDQINDNNKMMNEKKDIVKNISLSFLYEGNNISIQCQSNEKIQVTIKKFCCKMTTKADSFFFFFNGKKLIENLTIEENGLSNNDEILVVNKKDEAQIKDILKNPPKEHNKVQIIIFYNGRSISIMAYSDIRFSEAIKKFLMKAGLNKEDITCVYNSQKLDSNDNRKIEEIFNIVNNCVHLNIIDNHNVIGA